MKRLNPEIVERLESDPFHRGMSFFSTDEETQKKFSGVADAKFAVEQGAALIPFDTEREALEFADSSIEKAKAAGNYLSVIVAPGDTFPDTGAREDQWVIVVVMPVQPPGDTEETLLLLNLERFHH